MKLVFWQKLSFFLELFLVRKRDCTYKWSSVVKFTIFYEGYSQVLVLFILVKCSEHIRNLFLFYLWALWEIDNIRFMFGTTTLFFSFLYSVGFAQVWNDGGLVMPAHGASFPLDVLGWSCWISSRSATSTTHESSSFFDLIPDVFLKHTVVQLNFVRYNLRISLR